jgi:hypothetical protein
MLPVSCSRGAACLLALSLTGCGVAPEEGWGVQRQAQVSCAEECPPGSRIATFAVEERQFAYDTFGGAFFYQKDQCETYCEPETTCEPPNVPVVTAEGMSCQLLPRYATFPHVDDVDLSFGSLWDEAKVVP